MREWTGNSELGPGTSRAAQRELDLRYLAGPLKKYEGERGGGDGKESEEGREEKGKRRREGREGVECVRTTRVQPPLEVPPSPSVQSLRYDSRRTDGRKSCSIGATAAYPPLAPPVIVIITPGATRNRDV